MAYIIIAAAAVIGIACVLYAEIRENDERREQGLPPVKHHDITDEETETYFSTRLR